MLPNLPVGRHLRLTPADPRLAIFSTAASLCGSGTSGGDDFNSTSGTQLLWETVVARRSGQEIAGLAHRVGSSVVVRFEERETVDGLICDAIQYRIGTALALLVSFPFIPIFGSKCSKKLPVA